MASVVQIRSSQPIPKAVRDSSRYAQHGLALPVATLRALKKRGIYCQSSLTLEFQKLARRYVLRGVESGGAVVDMGRYCAYLNREGEPLPSVDAAEKVLQLLERALRGIEKARDLGSDLSVGEFDHVLHKQRIRSLNSIPTFKALTELVNALEAAHSQSRAA